MRMEKQGNGKLVDNKLEISSEESKSDDNVDVVPEEVNKKQKSVD